MNYNELKKRLLAAGCYMAKQKSNHEWWYSPHTEQRHNKMDIGKNLLKQISKESGVKL